MPRSSDIVTVLISNRISQVFVFMLLVACNLKAQETYPLTGNYKDGSFSGFVTRAESLLPVKFFYKEEWVKDLKMGEYSNCQTLTCILDHIFSGTALYYFIEESGNIIITKNYAIKFPEMADDKNKNYLTPGENPGLVEKQSETHEIIELGDPAEKHRAGQVTISGYITDQDSKESVPGATVYSKKLRTGTISNEFGYYSLTLPRGNHLIHITSIGMKEKVISLNLNGTGEMNVDMKSTITPLKAVVVTSEKSLTLQRFEVGAERINLASFKLLPTTMGELDILKSILLIPGVKSVGEGSVGFNVRGGSADQNLILLYGAPVYNSSHFFGFFSAVNSDIIRDVTLYKGGIPARYGGRISSVLDIGTKDGNRKEFGGNAGISPITTHIMVEGPIIKDTLTYILAARTTYSNWILGLVNNRMLQNSRASFYDLNGKVSYEMNKNNKIEFAAYYSHDDFRFNNDTVYNYSNHIFAIKWRHFFGSRFFSSISANNSSNTYDISSGDIPYEAFVLSHKLNSTSLKSDFNWFVGKSEFNFGLDLTRYLLNPGNYEPDDDSSRVVSRKLEKERAWEGALYLDDKITLTDFLSIEAGLRISGFFSLGPQSVMVYNPAFSKSKSTITDTLSFTSGEVIRKYAGPEFRLSLNFRLSSKSSFKINYNRTRQYLHLLSNSAAISPSDIWKLSDYYLQPQTGDQIAAGFYEIFRQNRYEFSAEIYHKNLRNMIDFKGGTNIVMNENIEKDVVSVKGKAYGMELTLKKTAGKVRYNLGYTYSRIYIKSLGEFSMDQINSGKWFPANFDRPHDLVLTCNYLLSRRVSFSGNFTWTSGRPITFPVASYIIYDNKLIHYSGRNKYRLPDYSRLDLSFTISGNLKSNKLAHPKWTFSVYNVLARQNVYSIYYRKDGDIIKGYKLTIFGRAIPSVTYSFDF